MFHRLCVCHLQLNREKSCTAKPLYLLTDCPWCTLDNQGVIYFIDLGEEVITTGGILCWQKSGRW